MVTTPTVWKDQAQINLSDAGDQSAPAIISIGNGRYLVAWTESSGGPIAGSAGADIVGQIFDALGNPVGTEFQLNKNFYADNESDVALAGRPGGGFVMAYVDDGGGDSIRFQTFDIDGNKIDTPTYTVATGGADNLDAPQIAMASNGSWLVTYERDHGAENIDIVGAIVNANGTVGAEFEIADDAESLLLPSVAALSNGTFVVAFENEYAGASENTFISYRIVTPGSPPTVGSLKYADYIDSGVDQEHPKVAALDNGGFVIVYNDNAAGSDDIRAVVLDNAGNVVKAAFTVNNNTAGAQNEPVVTALKDGGFVVVWDDDNLNVMMGQRFDASGSEVGGEFIAGDQGNETNPTITVLDDGRFMVGFEQQAGDDDVWGTVFDPRGNKIKGTGDDDILTALADGGTVVGKGGKDKLLGSSGDDTLKGGAGKDYLVGMDGNDVLKGGAKKDFFVFAAALDKNANVDKITDFSKKQKDKILLLDDLFSSIGSKLNKGEFHLGKEAKDGNDYILAKVKKGKAVLFYDADGDGAGAKVKFAKVESKGGFELNHKSFKIIDDLDI